MQDTRAVAEKILALDDAILSQYGLKREQIALMAGLHDIGKISPKFQSKCKEWLIQNDLGRKARNGCGYTNEGNHAKIPQYTIKNFLECGSTDERSAEYWAALLGCGLLLVKPI